MSLFWQRVRAALHLLAHKALTLPGRFELGRRGYVSLFNARPPDAYPPDWADLWFIYQTVRERKPATVLEFGSGCSTIMIAQALADNAAEGSPGHLHSLDTKPEPGGTDWAQVTLDSIPGDLKQFCTLKSTSVSLSEYEGHPVWRYDEVPDISPDFIYLDGPDFVNSPHKVAANVLDLEPGFSPEFRLLVDGRTKNCSFLDAHFKKRYRKTNHQWLHNTVYDLVEI